MKRIANFLAGVACLLLIAAILYPVFAQSKGGGPDKSRCMSKLKQCSLALLSYASDSDGRFPNADAWTDATILYLMPQGDRAQALHFDMAPWVRCPTVAKSGYGYAFNRGLSQAKIPENPGLVPMIYDSTNLARNASDSVTSLPVPGRHWGHDFVGFVDGHVAPVTEPMP